MRANAEGRTRAQKWIILFAGSEARNFTANIAGRPQGGVSGACARECKRESEKRDESKGIMIHALSLYSTKFWPREEGRPSWEESHQIGTGRAYTHTDTSLYCFLCKDYIDTNYSSAP